MDFSCKTDYSFANKSLTLIILFRETEKQLDLAAHHNISKIQCIMCMYNVVEKSPLTQCTLQMTESQLLECHNWQEFRHVPLVFSANRQISQFPCNILHYQSHFMLWPYFFNVFLGDAFPGDVYICLWHPPLFRNHWRRTVVVMFPW